MKQYQVSILLDNGNKIQARVSARNSDDALRRIRQSEQYREFVGDASVVDTTVVGEDITPIDNNRYIIKAVDNMRGWCVCLDTDTSIRVMWRKGDYNGKQKVSIAQPLPPLEEATALRQIADFLQENFNELL